MVCDSTWQPSASLEAFAQLGTELDPATQQQLDRGYRMVELLKQQQYQPMDVADQVVSIYAGTRGYLDDVPVDRVREFELGLLTFVRDRKPELLKDIVSKKWDEVEESVKSAVVSFKASFR